MRNQNREGEEGHLKIQRKTEKGEEEDLANQRGRDEIEDRTEKIMTAETMTEGQIKEETGVMK